MKATSFHHFKGKNLTPSEKIERKVVQLLLNTKVPDSKRDTSIIFELKHSSECVSVARILAQKRGLSIDLAEVASVLHDISVIVSGKYKDHGPLGGKIARKILEKIGGFGPKKIETICNAVSHHSEKDVYSKNPYLELVKDADVFSCSLYKNAGDEYQRIKSKAMFGHYQKRVKRVRLELNLPKSPTFRV